MKPIDAPVTIGFALTCIILFAFLSVTGLVGHVGMAAGMVPARLGTELFVFDGATVPAMLTPITAAFLHHDALHLLFNMVFLIYIGRQVELPLGAKATILLMVGGAYAAALATWASDPGSTAIGVGASGVVSALIACYALIFNRQQVRALGPIPGIWVRILWLAAAWIGLQLLIGFASNMAPSNDRVVPGIWAHIGGFLAGLLLTRPLLRWRFGAR
ncbi:MAG TPA: rhomboid family intramembrane serine protease [Sphingopyxis sp.]|nr:rhomboid family intramembrane serine protease [Sphingopyxis sp.]